MVASWPNTSSPPPSSTSPTPHQLPSKGMRSGRSLCCQTKNAAKGGINTQWLYSGLLVPPAPRSQRPSQKSHRLKPTMTVARSIGPQDKRQTKSVVPAPSNTFTDMLLLLRCRPELLPFHAVCPRPPAAQPTLINTGLVLQQRDASGPSNSLLCHIQARP